jgi:hypothetical protein
VTRRKKPKPMLPSEAEIATLPRLARVAFAARCTARVQPLTNGAVHAGEPPDAVAAAAVAILRVSPRPGELILFRHDFDRLRRLAKANNWTDDTPVPPEVFGPMWPGRVPKWARQTNEPRE